MHIRRGEAGDIEEIARFDSLTKRGSARYTDIVAALDSERVFVAEIGSRVAGFLMLTDRLLGHPFIELVVVSADFRRQGVATTLIDSVIGKLSGRRCFTSTNESNTAAQSLFQQLGFVACGRIEGLDEGDPEIVYYNDVL